MRAQIAWNRTEQENCDNTAHAASQASNTPTLGEQARPVESSVKQPFQAPFKFSAPVEEVSTKQSDNTFEKQMRIPSGLLSIESLAVPEGLQHPQANRAYAQTPRSMQERKQAHQQAKQAFSNFLQSPQARALSPVRSEKLKRLFGQLMERIDPSQSNLQTPSSTRSVSTAPQTPTHY